jgi:hypothetical protein
MDDVSQSQVSRTTRKILGYKRCLARVHDNIERPRCLCVPGGVEMRVGAWRRVSA